MHRLRRRFARGVRPMHQAFDLLDNSPAALHFNLMRLRCRRNVCAAMRASLLMSMHITIAAATKLEPRRHSALGGLMSGRIEPSSRSAP